MSISAHPRLKGFYHRPLRVIGPSPRIFNTPFIFILPQSNTFSPNSAGRWTLRPGTTMVKIANHQCLPARERTGATALQRDRSHPKTKFSKKRNCGTPEFLFFRRITIFQDRMLFSRRKIPRILPSATICRGPPPATGHQCDRCSLTCGWVPVSGVLG